MIEGRNRRRTSGLTVVELLIAGFIVTVILGLASVFLGRQVQLQRNVQAQSSVQDTVRVASQLLSQDLALVGNRIIVADDGSVEPISFGCFDGTITDCLRLETDSTEPYSATLSLRYLSSQYPSGARCRDVGYRLSGTALQRSDVPCPVDAEPFEPDESQWLTIADGAVGFKVVVICSNGLRVDAVPGTCAPPDAYARSALVTVAAESQRPSDGGVAYRTMRLVTTDPESPHLIECSDGARCFAMTEETHMPNLKDQ